MARPTLRIFLMTTAGVLFAGGVAAAATGNKGLPPRLAVADYWGPPTTVGGHTTTTIEALASDDDGEALTPDEIAAICAEALNQGVAVSAVAHDKNAVGADHGAGTADCLGVA